MVCAEGIYYWDELLTSSIYGPVIIHITYFSPKDSQWHDLTFLLSSGESLGQIYISQGVVAASIFSNNSATAIYAAIYHPLDGLWYSTRKDVPYKEWSLKITSGTIEYWDTTPQTGIVFSDFLGFDPEQRLWRNNQYTSIYPYFEAQAGDAKDVYFWDLSLGTDPSSYQWYFGDGQTGSDRAPYHVYPAYSKYHVMLFASSQWCNTPEAYSTDVKTDYRPPEGSIKINQGAKYTNSTEVSLDLSGVTDNSGTLTWYRDRNEGGDWSAWCEYSTSLRSFSLTPGEGVKKVEVEIQDFAGNVGSFAAQIILDTTRPQGSISGPALSNSFVVTLNLGATDNLSPTQDIAMSFRHDTFSGTWSPWESFRTPVQYSLPGPEGKHTIYVQYRDGAGNLLGSGAAGDPYLYATITVDENPPTGTVAINNGAQYTNNPSVTVNVTASDISGVAKVYLGSSGDFTKATAMAYTPGAGYPWSLSPSDGAQTVYAWLEDGMGNVTYSGLPLTASIILDRKLPSGAITINGGALYTKTQVVTLNLFGSDDSGMDYVAVSNDNSTWTHFPCDTSQPWTLLPGDGLKTVYAAFVDKAGNSYGPVTAGITLASTAPTGSIKINGGAAYTRINAVTLSLYATSASQMCFSSDSSTWSDWEPYGSTRMWSFYVPDGLKWVYVKYRDGAMNESTVLGASITLDSTPPTDGTLSVKLGKGQINLTWSGFSDAVSGLDRYQVFFSKSGTPAAVEANNIYEGPAQTYSHAPLLGGTYYYRVCAVDKAGNASSGATNKYSPKEATLDVIWLLLLEEGGP